MVREKAERLYPHRLQAFITKATEDALLKILQTGFESLKGGLMNNSYVFIEHVVTKMAHNGALDELFDRSIER